jgi:pilus assembly protein CpaF
MNPATDSTQILATRVRERVASGAGKWEDVLTEEIALHQQHAPHEDSQISLQSVRNELVGFGALQPYLDDPSVEEVWINAPDRVFIARAGLSEHLGITLTPDTIKALVERMLRPTGRRVDMSQPFVDASLPDGSRLHVAIPDITRAHWSVNIRKFSPSLRTLADLVAAEVLSLPAAHYLRSLVVAGKSILISGATQAGKTTLLTALLHAAPAHERVVTVEETFELNLDQVDHVGLQCRSASLEGTGEVTLRRLVKEALRMRPDRIVVGEVREAEALDLLIALNSGLPGMCSIHAKSAEQALVKLSTLPLLAGRNIDASFVLPTVAGTIDAVVHLERSPEGVRRVTTIITPTGTVTEGHIDSVTRFDRRGGVLRAIDETQ